MPVVTCQARQTGRVCWWLLLADRHCVTLYLLLRQGELLLDVLVLGPQNASHILYCGDTAQVGNLGGRGLMVAFCLWALQTVS